MKTQGNLTNLGLLWTNLTTNPVLTGLVTQTCVDVFERRLRNEGIDFLTKTLPSLGKDFDRMLIGGDPLIITGRFRKQTGSELPEFLYNLFHKVLKNDGSLRPNASPQHIKWIRQLTLMYYKLEVEYGKILLKSAIADFCTRDTALDTPLYYVEVSGRLHENHAGLERAAAQVYGVLNRREDCTRKLVPRHGPGATACGTLPQDKYHKVPRFIERLHQVFDYSEFFFLNANHLVDELDRLTDAGDLYQPVAKLTAVPKDSRGPRLICMEPREMQYIQQGLMRYLYDLIERHPMTHGRVNFTDQSINQRMACIGSSDGSYATLDLKDASDRVRWDLVQILFPANWVRALKACRTEYVQLPNEEGILGPLKKFAPMGSAVCFPVESLVFWGLISGNVCKDVYVYGDDIILPTAHVSEAIALLESVDLKVNIEKSCYKTSFRESCGGDYFNGTDVGYVKVRKWIDSTISSHQSLVGFVNEIIKSYGVDCARGLMRLCDDLYGPHVRSLSGVELSYYCEASASNDVFFKRRWNKALQKYEHRIPAIKSGYHKIRSYTRPKSHWCELLRRLATSDTTVKDNSELKYTRVLPEAKAGHRMGEYADGTCTIKEAWRGDL